MSKLRVLYISQEIYPYLPDSDMARTVRHLPQAIQELGGEVRMFMPRYGVINERRNQLHEVIRLSGTNLVINHNDHPIIIKVASIPSARMQVYFIDNEDFFKRKSLFGSTTSGTNDNDERSIFFVCGVLETIKRLKWVPDVIHCHGWFTALATLYLRKVYQDDPCFKKAKIVYSVYDEPDSDHMPEGLVDKLKGEGFKAPALAPLSGESSWEALQRLAAHHAHGVVQSAESLSPELSQYLLEGDRKFLIAPRGEGYAEVYNQFYQQL